VENPYVSPIKENQMNLKIPRSEATKKRYFFILRKLDWNGYGYYEKI
jgi:hypothetical protein